MAIATFDTLKFANTLKAAGVPEKQAEAQAIAFAEVMQLNLKELVTKDDLQLAVSELRREISDLMTEVKQDLKEESLKINNKIDTLQAKLNGEMALLRWMLGIIITILAGIAIRLFFFRGT